MLPCAFRKSRHSASRYLCKLSVHRVIKSIMTIKHGLALLWCFDIQTYLHVIVATVIVTVQQWMETACKRAESARFHVAYFIRTNTLRGKIVAGKNVYGFDFQKIVICGTNAWGFAKNLRICGKNVFLSEKEVEFL